MTGFDGAGEDEQQRLSSLLRRCRTGIAPNCRSLGSHPRLPTRFGKAVTQEEVAEAAGISRVWYARLESDRPSRVSASVLGRIADALMMRPAERVALFRLAVPEFSSASLTHRPAIILEAFGSLRRLTTRLRDASSEAEALTLLREHAMTTLAPDAIVTCTRVGEGRWDHAATGDDDCGNSFHESIRRRWGNAAIEELHGYTLMAQPGELTIRSNGPDVSFAMANIRSPRGFFARLSLVHFRAHEYSQIEREQLSTFADLASLALS